MLVGPRFAASPTDAAILAAIARFFAAKFRAACAWELYLLCNEPQFRERATVFYRQAAEFWRASVHEFEGVYHDDLSYGPHHWLRGSWRRRLPAILRDVADMESWSSNYTTLPARDHAAISRAIEALARWVPVDCRTISYKVPQAFVPGEAVRISCEGEVSAMDAVILHYRRVNQADAWRLVEMQRDDIGFAATIPGEYTRSGYPLMFYFSWIVGDRIVLAPGLTDDLDSLPYMVIRQANG